MKEAEVQHVPARQLEAYRRRTLDAEALVATAEHLLACERCRAQAGGDGALDAAVTALQRELAAGAEGDVHPGYGEIEDWVDGRLAAAGRARLDAHLGGCPACALEASDLAAVRAALAADGVLREPAAATAAPGLPPRVPMRPWAAWLAGAAAAVVVAWVATLPLRSELRAVRARLAGVEDAHARLQATLASTPAPVAAGTILVDGSRRVALGPGGEVAGLPELPAPLAADVKRALATGRLEVLARAGDLAGGRETLMGAGDGAPAFGPLEPVAAVVESDRPALRWRPLPGAKAYVVSVYDEALRLVATSPRLGATEWAPVSPLARGAVYTWQVTAFTPAGELTAPAPPAGEARFQVLGRADAALLRRARAEAGTSHLAMAVAYASAGLEKEAERELRALAAANPGAPLPRSLLASLPRR
jgi:hypothetical protein